MKRKMLAKDLIKNMDNFEIFKTDVDAMDRQLDAYETLIKKLASKCTTKDFSNAMQKTKKELY